MIARTRTTPARRFSRALALALASLLAIPLATSPLRAQGLTRPWLEWKTARTEHFDVHYPARMSEWAEETIVRLDAVHEAVSAMVGSAPRRRVTVVIEDPANVSNGFALPFLRTPTIFLFATPPDPGNGIAANRGWGEILSVHEYAHIAHITRPTRNPGEQRRWRLMPISVGPIARKSPRWITEGYATYVEGRLTGTGRPHTAGRAAVIRQWALEGRLPTYGALNGTQDFQQGAMAYLVGSAFIEWLVEKRGDQSIVNLWKRMTARQQRSFDESFAGVYGALPAELYGRFTAEVTGRALAVEGMLDSAGLRAGEEVQRLSWYTGRIATSRDGGRIAVPLSFRDDVGRIVIWQTEADTITDKEREARERARARDPEDVPGIEWRPRARKPIATLRAHRGIAWGNPRFFADSTRLLVTRPVGRGDGTVRPELFEWNTRTGDVRQVTDGEAIRWGDPSPDGRRAVGTRCREGLCDLVRIDLASGSVTVLHAGAPRVVYSTPRYSPDGRSVAVTVQRGDTVRVALTDDTGAPLRFVGPADGVRRYDASFSADGRALYLVSESGGIPNVERLPLEGGAPTTMTRVTGAVQSPAPNEPKREVYFLSMETRGFNLRRVALDSVAPGPVVAIASPSLVPAAPRRGFAADTFAAVAADAPRSYGAGPRRHRLVPFLSAGADGWAPGLALLSADPVGRLAWTLQGAWADRGAWEGGALAAAWRGTRPTVEGELFGIAHEPGAAKDAMPFASSHDTRYLGGRIGLTLDRPFGWRTHRYRLGASWGWLDPDALDEDLERRLAYLEHASAYQLLAGKRAALQARIGLHGSAGETGPLDWQRLIVAGGATARLGGIAVRADGTVGWMNADAPGYEQFQVGGGAPVLVDEVLFPQRFTMPALPLGARTGSHAATVRFAIPGNLFEPYWWAASAGRDLEGWTRVIGAESRGSFGTLSGPMLAGLTGVSWRGGVAYPLDEPLRRRVRGYFSLEWNP